MNPHFPAPKENLAEGHAALEKAKAIGAKTQRERDYIDALLAFYSGDEKVSFGQRVQAYLKATEELAARYPDDDDAQIAHAITLNVAASPSDKTYSNQLKGAVMQYRLHAAGPPPLRQPDPVITATGSAGLKAYYASKVN